MVQKAHVLVFPQIMLTSKWIINKFKNLIYLPAAKNSNISKCLLKINAFPFKIHNSYALVKH